MARSTQNRLILAALTLLLLMVPLTSYLMLQRAKFEHTINSQFPNSTQAPEVSLPKTTSSVEEFKSNVALMPSPTPGFIMEGEPAILGAEASASGLKLRVKISDRPANDQSTKLFVGISQGFTVPDPKYLLSFLVNLDQSGQYSGISLSGLTPNGNYTAYIKGSSSLAVTHEFTFQSGLTDLGLIPLTSGDVNNDNKIDQNDILEIKKSLGKAANPDSNLDLNGDGIINSFDLAIVNQNLGKSGEAGVIMPNSDEATGSATFQTPDVTTPQAGSSATGYWLWIPKAD